MHYSIPSTQILLILRYQHITRQIKQYLTCKHDILKTCNCKGGRIKMTTIVKLGFIFTVQLAYPQSYPKYSVNLLGLTENLNLK